jgi:hypothetical protein
MPLLFGKIWDKVSGRALDLADVIRQKRRSALGKDTSVGHVSEEHAPAKPAPMWRKLLPAIIAGGAVCVAGVIVVVVLGTRDVEEKATVAPKKAALPLREGTIEKADVFLPPEPDYVPDFVPPRPRRQEWTPSQMEEFWTPPSGLGDSAEDLREKLSDTMDNIMERIP